MQSTYTCTLRIHVPYVGMYPMYTCTLCIHAPLYTCTLCIHVPYVYMYLTYTCALRIHVPYIYMCPTYTCTLRIHVPYGYMYPTYTCTYPTCLSQSGQTQFSLQIENWQPTSFACVFLFIVSLSLWYSALWAGGSRFILALVGDKTVCRYNRIYIASFGCELQVLPSSLATNQHQPRLFATCIAPAN